MKRSTIAQTFAIAAVAALASAIAPAANAADKGCSNNSIKGTFAFKGTGTHFPPTGAALLDVVFAQTFDGNGGLTSAGIQSDGGKIVQVTQTGTYTVNPDCSGTYTAQLSLGFTVHFFFLIADSGNELVVISADANTVLSGTARRLFPAGDWRE